MPGALVFGAVNSDRVTCGAPANATAFTTIQWIYPTTLGGYFIMSRKNATSPTWRIALTGASGAVEFVHQRATTFMEFITSSLLLSVNTWYCVAGSMTQTGPVTKIYIGSLTTPMAEPTYSASTAGAGTYGDVTGVNLNLGNRDNSPTVAFNGRIGMAGYFASAFTLAQCESWRQRPRVTVDGITAIRFYRLGKSGADAIEYTGAGNGTVTGATQGDGPPLHQGECLWQRDHISGLYHMAA